MLDGQIELLGVGRRRRRLEYRLLWLLASVILVHGRTCWRFHASLRESIYLLHACLYLPDVPMVFGALAVLSNRQFMRFLCSQSTIRCQRPVCKYSSERGQQLFVAI